MEESSLVADFRLALSRLRDGKPTHPDLAGKPVRISIATVALEAGHSRNSLYLPQYQAIGDEIRMSRHRKQHRKSPKTRDELLDTMRDRVKTLENALDKLATENLMLFHRMVQAESRVERLKAKLERNDIQLKTRRHRA